jgi:hypothetical protein
MQVVLGDQVLKLLGVPLRPGTCNRSTATCPVECGDLTEAPPMTETTPPGQCVAQQSEVATLAGSTSLTLSWPL